MVFATLTIANPAKAGLGWTAWKPLITSAGNLAGYERLAELALGEGTYRHWVQFKANPAMPRSYYCAVRSCRCNGSPLFGWTDLGVGNGYASVYRFTYDDANEIGTWDYDFSLTSKNNFVSHEYTPERSAPSIDDDDEGPSTEL